MENKRELVTLRIPASTNQKLASITRDLGISKNAFLLNLINKEIRKSDKQNKKSDTSQIK